MDAVISAFLLLIQALIMTAAVLGIFWCAFEALNTMLEDEINDINEEYHADPTSTKDV
jgi:diacylglycerol kinase